MERVIAVSPVTGLVRTGQRIDFGSKIVHLPVQCLLTDAVAVGEAYGQSRMGWMTTPDGREGWSDMFLRKGHSVFLIDEYR